MGEKQITKSSQVIILIGAGASVPFGIPAMHGLFKNFMDKRKSGIGQKEKKLCQFLTKEIGIREDLEEFLLAANTIVDFRGVSVSKLIEKTISPRKNTLQIKKYREKLNEYIMEIGSLRKKILQYMSDICFRFDRSESVHVLCGFVKALAKRGYPIYTTNYDYIFEYVAQEASLQINDNFIQQNRQILWNFQIDFPRGNALTIIKLHGSVTWYANENGLIEKIYYDTKTNPLGDRIERVIVFPTRFKDIYDQHFFALYSHFLSALDSAKCLVVIGHSLRDEYLRAAIIERYRKRNFQIIIVDPRFPDELPKEMNPFKGNVSGNIIHMPYYFEKISDEIAHAIINVEPTDIAGYCAKVVHYNKSRKNKIKIKGNIRTLKPGAKKKFEVEIDAYLKRHEKPAYLRVWIEATYKKGGALNNEISGMFLEDKEIQIATKLSGMIKKKLPIVITMPEIEDWLDYANKVKLCVGILKKNIKRPYQVSQQHILAKDNRELGYTR